MTTELADFAARLRECIKSWTCVVGDAMDFDPLALELFRLQFKHNVTYRRICEARQVSPGTVEHWTQIPSVPAAAFKELELTSLPRAGRTTVFQSSGTSGQGPSRHFHNAESLALYEISLWPWFRAHVLPDWPSAIGHLQFAMLTPPPLQGPHSSLVHMFETVRRELGLGRPPFLGKVGRDGAWSLDFAAVLRTLRAACDSQTPLVLLGTAFSFVQLLDHLAERALRFELPTGSRVMETGGYKGRSRNLSKSELHALIIERLGVPASHLVCEYGMSELSSQAYDRVSGVKCQVSGGASLTTRLFHFPPWARAQIISPETGVEVGDGGTGLIRVFDLANVFSVLAIQTEDLGIRRGDGFELIGRAPLAEPRGCSYRTVDP